MEMLQYPLTIDSVLKYEEELIDSVERQIKLENNPEAKKVLLMLKTLLKGKAVKSFVDLLASRKFSLSSFHKIQEIDDALDELRILHLNLPYPEKRFTIEQGKRFRARRNIMMTLLLGLFGFEWVK